MHMDSQGALVGVGLRIFTPTQLSDLAEAACGATSQYNLDPEPTLREEGWQLEGLPTIKTTSPQITVPEMGGHQK